MTKWLFDNHYLFLLHRWNEGISLEMKILLPLYGSASFMCVSVQSTIAWTQKMVLKLLEQFTMKLFVFILILIHLLREVSSEKKPPRGGNKYRLVSRTQETW